MDLKTIQTRKSNPVFVKMSSSTQPNWKISKQQSPKPEQVPQVLEQQLKEPGDINDSAREGAKAVELRPLTEKALEKQDEETPRERLDHPQQNALLKKTFTPINERSLMRESICSKVVTSSIITSGTWKSSKMSTSQFNGQLLKSEQL